MKRIQYGIRDINEERCLHRKVLEAATSYVKIFSDYIIVSEKLFLNISERGYYFFEKLHLQKKIGFYLRTMHVNEYTAKIRTYCTCDSTFNI